MYLSTSIGRIEKFTLLSICTQWKFWGRYITARNISKIPTSSWMRWTKAIGKSFSSGKIFRRPSVGITRKYEFGSAVLLMISRSEKNFWARKFASDIVLGFWASEQTWNSLLRYSKGLSFDDTEYWWMSCDFLKIFNSLWIRLAWCKSKNVTVQRYYSLTIFKVVCLLLYWICN